MLEGVLDVLTAVIIASWMRIWKGHLIRNAVRFMGHTRSAKPEIAVHSPNLKQQSMKQYASPLQATTSTAWPMRTDRYGHSIRSMTKRGVLRITVR